MYIVQHWCEKNTFIKQHDMVERKRGIRVKLKNNCICSVKHWTAHYSEQFIVSICAMVFSLSFRLMGLTSIPAFDWYVTILYYVMAFQLTKPNKFRSVCAWYNDGICMVRLVFSFTLQCGHNDVVRHHPSNSLTSFRRCRASIHKSFICFWVHDDSL